MSLLVLTNSITSININPPPRVVLKIGLTPAGAKGEPGIAGPPGSPVPITNVIGQSTTEAVSQKLFTDNLFEDNQKTLLVSLTEATDILDFTNILDEALE